MSTFPAFSHPLLSALTSSSTTGPHEAEHPAHGTTWVTFAFMAGCTRQSCDPCGGGAVDGGWASCRCRCGAWSHACAHTPHARCARCSPATLRVAHRQPHLAQRHHVATRRTAPALPPRGLALACPTTGTAYTDTSTLPASQTCQGAATTRHCAGGGMPSPPSPAHAILLTNPFVARQTFPSLSYQRHPLSGRLADPSCARRARLPPLHGDRRARRRQRSRRRMVCGRCAPALRPHHPHTRCLDPRR